MEFHFLLYWIKPKRINLFTLKNNNLLTGEVYKTNSLFTGKKYIDLKYMIHIRYKKKIRN